MTFTDPDTGAVIFEVESSVLPAFGGRTGASSRSWNPSSCQVQQWLAASGIGESLR